jgi:hypothetical protein
MQIGWMLHNIHQIDADFIAFDNTSTAEAFLDHFGNDDIERAKRMW